jgi:transposase
LQPLFLFSCYFFEIWQCSISRLRIFQTASYDGPIDGHKFLHFLDSHLVPTLRDGDVVVMDNLRVHHIEEVEKRLKAVGARPLFLPPYSPERNPIEEIWSLFKRIFRSEEAKTISELINAMKKAVLATTPVKIEAFFAHAAYC